ncbi:hypothetical protein GLE_1404 [Lysobacter enzymogenes]|uniref:Uncharacterized protein n=1 Tax=Lysobacter enzymogenes TaxID=69 RepID=A0A0S2DDY5_LYSEN|nr:hypothetical protein GLE_1404 [Lysobacter enzymogenes]
MGSRGGWHIGGSSCAAQPGGSRDPEFLVLSCPRRRGQRDGHRVADDRATAPRAEPSFGGGRAARGPSRQMR